MVRRSINFWLDGDAAGLNEDQDICLCFHVRLRKIRQFIRVRKPTKVSQLSECYGAGTGCGWCRETLKRVLSDESVAETIDHDDYRHSRASYREALSNAATETLPATETRSAGGTRSAGQAPPMGEDLPAS